MLLGLSFGLVVTVASDLVLTSASKDRVGAATGISETAFELGNALGIALTGSVVSVLYMIFSEGKANFTESVDTAAFTTSLAVNCAISGVLLAGLTMFVARGLRGRESTSAGAESPGSG
jgi:DHA2 family multidrug resistance protein-like MFS transporter